MRRAPALLYLAILAVSAVPGDDLVGLPDIVSVAGHALAYAALAITLVVSGRSGAATVAWCLVGAVVNELEQTLVPGRAADVTDVAIDAVGALAGILLARPLRRQRLREGSGSSAV